MITDDLKDNNYKDITGLNQQTLLGNSDYFEQSHIELPQSEKLELDLKELAFKGYMV